MSVFPWKTFSVKLSSLETFHYVQREVCICRLMCDKCYFKKINLYFFFFSDYLFLSSGPPSHFLLITYCLHQKFMTVSSDPAKHNCVSFTAYFHIFNITAVVHALLISKTIAVGFLFSLLSFLMPLLHFICSSKCSLYNRK